MALAPPEETFCETIPPPLRGSMRKFFPIMKLLQYRLIVEPRRTVG